MTGSDETMTAVNKKTGAEQRIGTKAVHEELKERRTSRNLDEDVMSKEFRIKNTFFYI